MSQNEASIGLAIAPMHWHNTGLVLAYYGIIRRKNWLINVRIKKIHREILHVATVLCRMSSWSCVLSWSSGVKHDDVIKGKHFLRYWLFARWTTSHRWIPLKRPVTLWCFLWYKYKILNKQSRCRCFEAPSRSLWHHCDVSDEMVKIYNHKGSELSSRKLRLQ